MQPSLRHAFAIQNREMANLAFNALVQSCLDAIQSNDVTMLETMDRKLSDQLVPYYHIVRSQSVDQQFVAGQLYALQVLVGGLCENQASLQDLQFAMASAHRRNILLALRSSGMLRAMDLRQVLGDDTRGTWDQLSHLLADLCQFGLIQRNRKGKGANYWLTSRGALVARDMDQRTHVNKRNRNVVHDGWATRFHGLWDRQDSTREIGHEKTSERETSRMNPARQAVINSVGESYVGFTSDSPRKDIRALRIDDLNDVVVIRVDEKLKEMVFK